MPILHAEIQIAGLRALCAAISFSFTQATDYAGRPNSTVHVGLLRVLLVGEAAAWPVWEAIKLDPYRRHSGHVVFFGGEGQTAKRLTFYDAALVHYQTRFNARGQNGKASLETELHFSAATVEVQGQRLEAHSVIPWATDAATSFRALTTPAAPLPSPNLAALVATGAVRAEQLAGDLVQRVVTAGGEVATEVLGVGVSALARAASLTAGLLLLPANDADAPGYEVEKAFGRVSKDAARLAYLESEQAHRALSAEEQQELVALLTKVRGIHVQHLPDGLPEGDLKGNKIVLPGFHFTTINYTKRTPEETNKLRRAFDSSIRKNFLKKLGTTPELKEKLLSSGLNDDEILDLSDGIQPDKYQVHHILPLDDSGDNSFNNLVLIRNDPYHKSITNLQNRLIKGMKPGDTKQLQWPVIKRSVYP